MDLQSPDVLAILGSQVLDIQIVEPVHGIGISVAYEAEPRQAFVFAGTADGQVVEGARRCVGQRDCQSPRVLCLLTVPGFHFKVHPFALRQDQQRSFGCA